MVTGQMKSTNGAAKIADQFDMESGKLEMLSDTLLKVERAKQEWETAVDAVPELICVINPLGRVLRANRTLERWGLGDVKSVYNVYLHSLLHPECAAPACRLAAIINDSSAEHKNVQRFSSYDPFLEKYIEIEIWPIREKNLAAANRVVVVRDVTERHQMEQRILQRNRRLDTLNTISGAILHARSPREIAVTALAQLKRAVPHQFAQIRLYDANQNAWTQLASSPPQMEHEGLLGESVYGQLDSMTVVDLSTKNSLSPILQKWCGYGINYLLVIPMEAQGKRLGFMEIGSAVNYPLTPEYQETLQEVAEVVTVGIIQAQLNTRLETMNRELSELLQAKDDAVQTLSHELRSPLSLFIGFIELLQDGQLGPVTDSQKEVLDILDNRSEQLVLLINRLLMLYRISADTLKMEPVLINRFVTDIQESWKTIAQNSGCRLQMELPAESPEIQADVVLLQKVISNLVDNAFKYAPQNEVILRVTPLADYIRIEVVDRGPGIPVDELDRVFERFYRIERDRKSQNSGFGLGLALCKSIVEAHRGTIHAWSKGAGMGTTFCIDLPRH